MTKEETKEVLKRLDQIYGEEKDGFWHQEQWQLLVAIMLSAQSTDLQVDAVLPELYRRFPHAEDVAEAPVEALEEAIQSIGLYHNKAKNMKECCRQIVSDFGGQVPDNREALMCLKGVGRKTANLYLADAHGIPGITVDTHVNRIANRLGWANHKDPLKVEQMLQEVLPKEHWIRINIQLIRHGRAICRARNPLCDKCDFCAYCADYITRRKTMDSDNK